MLKNAGVPKYYNPSAGGIVYFGNRKAIVVTPLNDLHFYILTGNIGLFLMILNVLNQKYFTNLF